MSVSREKLFEEVWAEPMTKVAKRYGVSSSYLARVCGRMNVPRPNRGYWARMFVWAAPARPKLPPTGPEHEAEWSKDGDRQPYRWDRVVVPVATGLEQLVPRTISGIHPVLVDAEEHFANSRTTHRMFSDGYLRPKKRLVPDLYVSSETVARAIKLANALYKKFEGAGFRVMFSPSHLSLPRRTPDVRSERSRKVEDLYHQGWRPDRPTVAFVGTVAIGLTVFELTENVLVGWQDGKYVRVR